MSFADKDAFLTFDRSVRRAFRFARTSEQSAFLAALAETSGSRIVTLKKGFGLFRAQIGHGWREQEVAPGEYDRFPAVYPPERMKPDPQHASDGRANAKGIPCLYMATNEKTAALEVRPLMGSLITMGYFVLEREVRIVDCSRKLIGNLARIVQEHWTLEDVEKQVWTDINDAFSVPTARADGDLDYVPTQIIAETLRLCGFDGIGYKSSFEEKGFNVALFDLDAARLTRRDLHRVGMVDLRLDMVDNTVFLRDDGSWAQAVITDIRPIDPS